MSGHELWHVVVLVSTLLGAACLAILLVAPLAFGPERPARYRRPLAGGVGAAVLVLVVEWLAIH